MSPRLIFYLFLSVLSTMSLSAMAEDKVECEPRELQQRQCHLTVGDLEIELRPENILVFGRTQARLFPTPIKSSLSAWDSVDIKKVKTQLFLDFVSWDMPGSAGQQLMQSILKINGDKLEPISTRAIQRKTWSAKKSSGEYSHRESAQILVHDDGKVEVKY